jgi:hypothetical protein
MPATSNARRLARVAAGAASADSGAEIDECSREFRPGGRVAKLLDGLGEHPIVADQPAMHAQRTTDAGRRAESPCKLDGAE